MTRLLERLDPTQGSQVSADTGLTMVLIGPHGSGKTHTLLYVRDQLEQKRPSGWVQLYARAEGDEFVPLFRQLVSSITAAQLGDFASRLDARVAADNLRRQARSTDSGALGPGDQAARRLDEIPDRLERYLESSLVDQSELLRSRALEVALPGRGREFQNALGFLTQTVEMRDLAAAWLTGRGVSDADRSKLGVSAPINDAQSAVWALRLIALLCRSAGRRLVVYLDQCEKLVLSADGRPARLRDESTAVLRAMDGLVDDGAFVVIAGTSELWSALPEDVRQRFGAERIQAEPLTLPEARSVAAVWLRRGAEGPADPPANELHPFDTAGVRAALMLGRGNMRRFLQICWAAFDDWAKESPQGLIESEHVRRVVQKRRTDYFDRALVTRAVESSLSRLGLASIRSLRVGAAEADLAVLPDKSTTNAAPRLLIQIQSAIFQVDEARGAEKTLELLKAQQSQAASPAPVLLIVCGYISREVTDDTLRKVTDGLLIYDPDRFEQMFETEVNRLIAATGPRRSPDADLLEAVEARLRAVLDERGAVSQAIQRNIVAASEGRPSELAAGWAEERKLIETQIAQARAGRLQDDLTELNRLRRESRNWFALLCALAVLGAGLAIGITVFNQVRQSLAKPVTLNIQAQETALRNRVRAYSNPEWTTAARALDEALASKTNEPQTWSKAHALVSRAVGGNVPTGFMVYMQDVGSGIEKTASSGFIKDARFLVDFLKTPGASLDTLIKATERPLSQAELLEVWRLSLVINQTTMAKAKSSLLKYANTVQLQPQSSIQAASEAIHYDTEESRATDVVLALSELASAWGIRWQDGDRSVPANRANDNDLLNAMLAGLMASGAVVVVGGIGCWLFVNRRFTGSVASTRDLERLARSEFGRRPIRSHDRDPLGRYAAATSLDPNEHGYDFMEALKQEPSRLIRAALARRLGHWSDLPPQALSLLPVADAAYAIEVKADRLVAQQRKSASNTEAPVQDAPGSLSRSEEFAQFSDPLRTVAALVGVRTAPEHGGLMLRIIALRKGWAIENESNLWALARAFERGSGVLRLGQIARLDISEIGRAADELSPFSETGLGQVDGLKVIGDIDRYYLFFRELMYLHSHVPADFESSPSP